MNTIDTCLSLFRQTAHIFYKQDVCNMDCGARRRKGWDVKNGREEDASPAFRGRAQRLGRKRRLSRSTYIVEKTDDSVTLAFKDANLTLITPLMDELYKDDNVDLVRYIDKHPELEDRRLYVKVKSGDPIAAIEKASDAVADYYSPKKE